VAEVEKRPRLEHEPQTKFDLALRAETVDSRAVPYSEGFLVRSRRVVDRSVSGPKNNAVHRIRRQVEVAEVRQVARFNVSQIIGAKNHAMPEFTLDSEVDLDRTRWLIVRRKQSWVRHTKPLAQAGPNEIWIRVLRTERIACQNLLPKRHNLRNYAANVNMVAANPCRRCDGASVHRNRVRPAA
jgi:hypothetical protein